MPKERLLEWHPRDGWEPLCRHLGVEVPEDVKGKPFPRINDPQTTQAILAGVVRSKWVSVGVRVAKVAVLGGVAVLGWRYWKGEVVIAEAGVMVDAIRHGLSEDEDGWLLISCKDLKN